MADDNLVEKGPEIAEVSVYRTRKGINVQETYQLLDQQLSRQSEELQNAVNAAIYNITSAIEGLYAKGGIIMQRTGQLIEFDSIGLFEDVFQQTKDDPKRKADIKGVLIALRNRKPQILKKGNLMAWGIEVDQLFEHPGIKLKIDSVLVFVPPRGNLNTLLLNVSGMPVTRDAIANYYFTKILKQNNIVIYNQGNINIPTFYLRYAIDLAMNSKDNEP